MQSITRPLQTVQARANRPASPDALDLLEQFGTTVRVARDGEVHADGDPAEFCYRIVVGCVRTVKLLEDGRRHVGRFYFAGDILGLDDLGTHAFAAEAVTEVTLRRYPRRMVEALAEGHTALSRRLRELALQSLGGARSHMVLLSRKTAIERIASFLLEMQSRLGRQQAGALDLPMNRADMADYLGLTVETICRVLATLKRDGVLKITRTGVEIKDRHALQEFACDVCV